MRTHWRSLILLAMLALVLRSLTALLMQQPGYTDAYYYAVGAQQIHAGHGFREPLIWNYLDMPQTVPHEGYLYWMPLPAILGWLGLAVFGDSFRAIQVPFVLLSILVPLVAYGIAWDLTRQRKHAMLAGVLALFPGFYAHVFVLPETFAPYALAGSICLWTAGRGLREQKPALFGIAGMAAGLGHLTRADGMLLAAVVVLAAMLAPVLSGTERTSWARTTLVSTALAVGGYLLVMGPWFARNWSIYGRPLVTSGTITILLTSYDDLFAYDRLPTLESYLAWGWQSILGSKWDALVLNLQRLWAEGLLIVLAPFTAAGLWQLRRERVLWPFLVYMPLLFVAMTFVFTLPGMRGGLFHSDAALIPFFVAVAGPGLEACLRWVIQRMPHWRMKRAWPVFGAGLAGLCVLVTAMTLWESLISHDWNRRNWGYVAIRDWLAAEQQSDALVMTGDSPGFVWLTGHQAIAVPNEPLDVILEVADRYGARYLVLDQARPRSTDELYAGTATNPGLHLRFVAGEGEKKWQLYEVVGQDAP